MLLKKINFIGNIIISNFKKIKYIYKVTFAVTYKCNLRCKICNIWKNSLQEKELEPREIEKIFRNLKHLNWIDLTGGEPTVRDDLLEIIDIIAENSKNLFLIHLASNGQNTFKIIKVTEKIINKRLIPLINISIDGPEKIHDNLRGKKGAYKEALSTFLELKKRFNRKGFFYISCTISSYNFKYIKDLLNELEKISFFSLEDIHFNFFHNSSHYYKNSEVKASLDFSMFKEIEGILKTFYRKGPFVKKILEMRYINGLSKYIRGTIRSKCIALNGSCFINPYGEVFPCSIYSVSLGNLRDYNYNLYRLFNGKKYSKIKDSIKNGKCPKCWSPCEVFFNLL